MSIYAKDKCSHEDLEIFKKKVDSFLATNGYNNLKILARREYDGNIIIYTGGEYTFKNKKVSFRRETPEKDINGNIVGWHGTRGIHTKKEKRACYAYRSEWTTKDKKMLLLSLKCSVISQERG